MIKPRWLDLILSKQKTWEMRGTGTSKRGLVHLAVSGGGGLILGSASSVDCLPAKREELGRHIDKHCIPDEELKMFYSDGKESGKKQKIYAWVLKAACRYKEPLQYKHTKGAIVWARPHKWFVGR